MIDETVGTGEAAGEIGSGDLLMTRRELFVGAGQVAVAGMSIPSLALLGACATPQDEPWADGSFWADGTGWID